MNKLCEYETKLKRRVKNIIYPYLGKILRQNVQTLIKDDKAAEITEQIEYDFSGFDKIRELRPELLDNSSNNYIQKHIEAP